MSKSTWTETSPVNLLVNGGFQADGTYATGWTLADATIAISSGACAVTATSSGGRIYQVVSGLRPRAEYCVGVSVNGGASANAARIYTTGGAQNFDQTFTTTDSAVVGGIVRTDASGSAITISLSVVSSGQTVTFDDAFMFNGNVRFWATHNALDIWRHHTDPTKIDGGDLQTGSVPDAALATDFMTAACVFPDAIMISHFDGPQPYNVDFTGNPNGHLGQQATFATTGCIWRPGKFGKAVQIAEATTNKVLNPSGEVDTSNTSVNTGTGTLSRITSDAHYGLACFQFQATAADAWAMWHTDSVAGSTTYTISAYLKAAAGTPIAIRAYDGVGELTGTGFGATTATGGWDRVGCVVTTNPGATLIRPMLRVPNGQTWLIDGVQCERKAYVTPYCDGSLGSGHSWSGTVHASASSRTACELEYAASGLLATVGSFSAWVYPQWAANDGVAHYLLSMGWGGDALDIVKFSDNKLYAGWYLGSGDRRVIMDAGAYTLNANAWNHIALTWDAAATDTVLYINGVAVGTSDNLVLTTGAPLALHVGTYLSNCEAPWNGLIDDLLIMPRALSATEVKALYDRGLPASPGAASTLDEWQPAVCYQTDAGQVIGTSSNTVINYEDRLADNCGWVTTGAAWRFTAYTAGNYHVSATITYSDLAWAAGDQSYLGISVNGTLRLRTMEEVDANVTQYLSQTITGDVMLAIGDYVAVEAWHNRGANSALRALAVMNHISIHRIPS